MAVHGGRIARSVAAAGAVARAGGMRKFQQLVLRAPAEQIVHDPVIERRRATCGQAGGHDRREELRRVEHPRQPLRAGAQSQGLQGQPDRKHRLLGDHLQGAEGGAYPDVPRVHRHPAERRGRTDGPRRRANRAYEQAKAFAEKEGLTLLEKTPFYDTDALATLPSFASAHKLSSIGDLAPLGKSVTLGGPPEFATREEGLPGLAKEYGVKPTFKPVAIEAPTTRSKAGRSRPRSCSRPTASCSAASSRC